VELLAERCAAMGLEAWDMTPAYDRFPANRTKFYADDGVHWSGEGHRLIARVIEQHLREGQWIERLAQRHERND
jgi:lysophospholipase L1-like esterase